MKRKITIAALALLVCIAAISGASAFGLMQNENAKQAIETGDYKGFMETVTAERNQRFRENMTEERFAQLQEKYQSRQAVQSALESGNYPAWAQAWEAMPRPPQMTDIITEENFSVFMAMHEARQSGDLETAKELAEELGLDMPGMAMGFKGKGRMPSTGFEGKGMNGFGRGCPLQ